MTVEGFPEWLDLDEEEEDCEGRTSAEDGEEDEGSLLSMCITSTT